MIKLKVSYEKFLDWMNMKIENFVRSKGSPTGKSIYYYRGELSKIYQKFKCRNFDMDTYG